MWMFVGDLHLTDSSKDEYRWGIFKWLMKQQEKLKPDGTFLAGDITDSKDRHSATLVNRIVAGLTILKPPVYIDMGNHDYRDPDNPFFKFLNHINGIHFITKPTVVTAGKDIAILPHVREQADFDAMVKFCARDHPAAFLCHQTFDGAIAESGVRLTGLSASPIESLKPELGVYAGDVHRPQTQGQVTYIGCPYNVRFGDNFEPRCIYVARDGTESYPWYEAPRKWSLTANSVESILGNKDLIEGDQVKLTIEMVREEAVEWKAIRKEVLDACKELKLEVHGCKLEVKTNTRRERAKLIQHSTKADTFDQFCKAEGLAKEVVKVGKAILNGHHET